MSEPDILTLAVDRISSLLDDILIRILSSLPTKQAFATRILSKRWIHLCCGVSDLDLSYVIFVDFHLNMIRLPSLKTLHLKHIMFKHVEGLALILEKFPVLKDLQLYNITSEGIYCRKSSEKELRKLNRANITMCCCYIAMKALSNLEFLRIQLSKVCLIIREYMMMHII